ncbi:MAG: MBL fold metallo-hydrolase [Spirochaetales bacterium]|nr:MBL fold metallo-hydrolase [Spirochaetales bacterium]
MKAQKICPGVTLVDIPDAGLSVLCGCPENAVKFLSQAGAIRSVERDGRSFETGPNAILLSELPVQNGRFCNLAEFPVLQMLYRQGMIVPKHPNNTGRRPMIIGMKDQVDAQADYIYHGNYGIVDPAALSPEDPDRGRAIVRMKLWFAYGAFRKTDELLDLRVLDRPIMSLGGGVLLRRVDVNRYEFIHGGSSVEVDLNLQAGETYGCPYTLPYRPAERHDFSIVHLGEGDGWDAARPCMSSLVIHRGQAYLVDAGPNIEESLDAVGIGVGGLRGIFHTHVHDDHFVGLTALMRAERRLRYYATPEVRRSAQAKLRALVGMEEREFPLFFEPRDLAPNQWNDVDGMSVMPVDSAHPLETTFFRFKAQWGNGAEKSFVHCADLSAFSVLDAMTVDKPDAPGISPTAAQAFKAAVLEPADLKKVDVGGGAIHGDPSDFRDDSSGDILLSHGISQASAEHAPKGRVAEFGEQTVFFPASQDWRTIMARAALRLYFPQASESEIQRLANHEYEFLKADDWLCKKGQAVSHVYLTVSGYLKRCDTQGRCRGRVRPGALVNAAECVRGAEAGSCFRASGGTIALAIPGGVFRDFMEKNGSLGRTHDVEEAFSSLSSCPHFADFESLPALAEMAAAAEHYHAPAGATIERPGSFLLIRKGRVAIFGGGGLVDFSGPHDIVCESEALGESDQFRVRSFEDVSAWAIPAWVVSDKPFVLWKLRERKEMRVAELALAFDFSWCDDYKLGHAELDDAHRRIFEAFGQAGTRAGHGALEAILALVDEHFGYEEGMMRDASYPGAASHHDSHERIRKEILDRLSGDSPVLDQSFGRFLKDCFIRHALVEDRTLLDWLAKKHGR